MKLKEFNPDNCITERKPSNPPAVGINITSGLFRFNSQSVALIGIKEGDLVVFHQDEEDAANWYLEKVKSKGFPVRCGTSTNKGIMFNSAKLAKLIAESVGFQGKHGRVLIAGTPTKFEKRQLWGVITGGLINK